MTRNHRIDASAFRRFAPFLFTLLVWTALAAKPALGAEACPSNAELAALCPSVITADVVALDQPYFFNRLGASLPSGQIFALRRDVQCLPGSHCRDDGLLPGEVMLDPDKRPRPLVLRVAQGQCLRIEFENLLTPSGSSEAGTAFETAYGIESAAPPTSTRDAGVHVMGLSLVAACDGGERAPAIHADASFAGANESSLAAPGEKRTYIYSADQEGAYLLHSTGAMAGLLYGNGQIAAGLHGMVNVEPPGAVFFRSQVTREDLLAANRRDNCPYALTQTDDGALCLTPHGQPVIDFWARDPSGEPILAMLDRETGELVASDLTAIIAHQSPDQPQPGAFPYDPDDPLCFPVPAATGQAPPETRCTRPFREVTTIYEEPLAATTQSLPCLMSGNSSIVDEGSWDSGTGDSGQTVTTITLPPAAATDSGDTVTKGVVTASQSECPPSWNITPYLRDLFSANGSIDSFAINYGMDAIVPRVLASRVRVGPMADCVGCKYEEFFLSSWPNGDPAQVSTQPAGLGTGAEDGSDEVILYPDDPSNVYHSYIGDPVKYRIASAGGAAAHVHHQHAHQWLHTPNASSSHYLDSQTLTPGATYTLEMVYSGAGNRNETVGDAIFHCHFYPHFASGMWSLWRVHDVFEAGTRIDPDTGRPTSAWQCTAKGEPVPAELCRDGGGDGEARWRLVAPNRALPDPVIAEGTPIPAVVPLPGLAMPPMPAKVALSPDGKRGLTLIETGESWNVLGRAPDLEGVIDGTTTQLVEIGEWTREQAIAVGNPGFPFFIPGLAGQRAVRPPLDVAVVEEAGESITLDGGLPRHRIGAKQQVAEVTDAAEVDGCTPDAAGNSFRECHTRHDFSKTLLKVDAVELDEQGESPERLAMLWHGELFEGGRVPSCDASGDCSARTSFRLNGSRPAKGAPFADPCALEDQWNGQTRRYKAAALQTDIVFTKDGWHFPQQRMISLWDDVEALLNGERAPEPLFFRANSGECIDFWHANLVPSEYALDDYQVRTPTDIIGQHIHLVKFDVTSSDGAANGFNYEDATFSPDEVRERIAAINAGGGLRAGEPCAEGRAGADGRCLLEAQPLPFFGPGPGGRWIGAMATVQRWMADPLEDTYGTDRTLRTVFTHDHLSPSTHQQTGLYAGLLVEPACSQWVDSWTGEVMGGSRDPGGEACEEVFAARPSDGGPTSWRANILYAEGAEQRLGGVREFALEFQDMALAYPRDALLPPDTLAVEEICPTCPGPSTGAAIGPSSLANKFNYGVDFPRAENSTPISAPQGPWPQAVSFGAMFGAYSINYRSEPLAPRVTGLDGSPPPADGERPANRDYAQVYRSIPRENPALDGQMNWYPPLTGGAEPLDPATPLLEAYAGDRVQIRTLTGAHFLNHQFSLRGLPWLFEPSLANSGYRAAQSTSLSEHFEVNVTLPREQGAPRVDYLYQTDAATQAQGKGGWGLMRVFGERQSFLEPLPGNEPPATFEAPAQAGAAPGSWVCSPESLAEKDGYRTRRYRILALAAASFEAGTPLPYRSPVDLQVLVTADDGSKSLQALETAVESPEALIYVLAEDVERGADGWRLGPGRLHEPLVLRAAAGDCIEVTLENHFDAEAAAFVTANPTAEALSDPLVGSAECTDERYLERLEEVRSGRDPEALEGYGELCAGSFAASTRVGLHPQLVAYDPLHGAGFDVGVNPPQTVPPRSPGEEAVPSRTLYWYAGHVETSPAGERTHTPVEFGAANLLPADALFQHSKGLFGALIIEPAGSSWVEDAHSRLQATVHPPEGEPFREGVLLLQDDLELYFRDLDGHYQALNVGNVGNFSGQTTAVGYGTESPLLRMAPPAPIDLAVTESAPPDPSEPAAYGNLFISDFVDQSCWLSSAQVGRDPSTTLLAAHAGRPYRIRLLHPVGNFTPQTFTLHGHGWQEEPYVPVERRDAGYAGPGPVPQTIGDNPFSQWLGSQGGVGSTEHFDIVLAPVSSGSDGDAKMRPNGAGGRFAVPGDYLYRTWQSNGFTGGTWGLFRVGPPVPDGEKRDIVTLISAIATDETLRPDEVEVVGSNTPILGSRPGETRWASRIDLFAGGAEGGVCRGQRLATLALGSPGGPSQPWTWSGALPRDTETLCASSDAGGVDEVAVTREIPCPAPALLDPKSQQSVERLEGLGGQQ